MMWMLLLLAALMGFTQFPASAMMIPESIHLPLVAITVSMVHTSSIQPSEAIPLAGTVSVVNVSLHLPTPPPALEVSSIGTSINLVVSEQSLIRNPTKTFPPHNVLPTVSASPTTILVDSIAPFSGTSQINALRTLSPESPILSAESGARLSSFLHIAQNPALVKPTEKPVSVEISPLPQPSQSVGETVPESIMIIPSVTSTFSLEAVNTAAPSNLIPLHSLAPTAVQNTLVGSSNMPEKSTQEHLKSSVIALNSKSPISVALLHSEVTSYTPMLLPVDITQNVMSTDPTSNLLTLPTAIPSMQFKATQSFSLEPTSSSTLFESNFHSSAQASDTMSLVDSSFIDTKNPISTSLSKSTLSPYSSNLESPLPTPPKPSTPRKNKELTGSLIMVTLTVVILFVAVSGCVMLTCTYIVHCRKVSKVDQIASRRKTSVGIDNPEYFTLNKDESATTLVDVSSGHPNQLNTSLESNNGSNDTVNWNSHFTNRQSSINGTKCILTPEGEAEVIEMENLQCSLSELKVVESPSSVVVMSSPSNRQLKPSNRHEYEELALNFAQSGDRNQILKHGHEYDEPVGSEAAIRRKGANGYEEPVARGQKRLSMPSLDDMSLVPLPQMQRRNSSVNELFTGSNLHTKGREKPGRILHYAEFSLYPSQNGGTSTQCAVDRLSSCATVTSVSKPPRELHEYEEPSFPLNCYSVQDFMHPIPTPTDLRKGVAMGDYEIPMVTSPLQSTKASVSMIFQVKMKLSRLSASINSSLNDEEHELLIEPEPKVRDGLSGSDQLSRPPRNSCLQDANANNLFNNWTMDGAYFFPSTNREDLLSVLKKLSVEFIPRNAIESKLASEQVQQHQGVWRKDNSGNKLDVSLKAIDLPAIGSAEDSDIREKELSRTKLLQEAVIMKQFRHPNIPRLYGVVNEERRTALVREFFPRGDLRKILVQMGRSVIPSDTPKLLLTYSQQVALGMQYLASKEFVHRDLCARNVFVTSRDICKVGGFGKSRDLTDVNDYVIKGGIVQVRWTAPEATYYQQYSTASDVWSYGCLLYEIWSLGKMPFRDCTNAEVIEKVESGYRLPPPPGCPRVVYNLMIQCWHPNPFQRPCFKDIINTLLQDEDRVLQIPFRYASTPHESATASFLGADLKTGAYMYSDLQQRYVKEMSLKGASSVTTTTTYRRTSSCSLFPPVQRNWRARIRRKGRRGVWMTRKRRGVSLGVCHLYPSHPCIILSLWSVTDQQPSMTE